ncbi:MAG: signal peptidase II [Candidatus Cloacimonetes bacterium]|nr:signal peptidase II [Candidatus Cloacimonadota bacterium]
MKKFHYFWIPLAVIILDQISKILVRNYIAVGDVIKITRKFIWITCVQNTGAAFSFSFGNAIINKIIFISITIVAIILIIYFIKKSNSRLEIISFALILGGAVGNLIDRIVIGSVTDFIWCDFPDFLMKRWPVFNIADSSIVIAICLMIGYTLFYRKDPVEDK